KSSHNKKRAMENLNFFNQDIGTSSSSGGHLTQKEAAKEAIEIRMSQKFALLEEEMPIIETMAYHDKKKKILDEIWKDEDHFLDFNIDDIPLLGEEGLLPFVCKIGKSSRNKKRAMENLNFFNQDIGTSSSSGGHLTQEEAAKEAIELRMSQKFALLEEERPIIETMAYHDKKKKILDEIWKDEVKLDGKIIK
nr:hypothetical protein [Tanacetum cinerariifolium]